MRSTNNPIFILYLVQCNIVQYLFVLSARHAGVLAARAGGVVIIYGDAEKVTFIFTTKLVKINMLYD